MNKNELANKIRGIDGLTNGQEAAVQERLGQLRKDLDCIDFALEYYNFA